MHSTVIPVSDVCVREVNNEKKDSFVSSMTIDRITANCTKVSGGDDAELIELLMPFKIVQIVSSLREA
jgi:RNA-binding protein YlmH